MRHFELYGAELRGVYFVFLLEFDEIEKLIQMMNRIMIGGDFHFSRDSVAESHVLPRGVGGSRQRFHDVQSRKTLRRNGAGDDESRKFPGENERPIGEFRLRKRLACSVRLHFRYGPQRETPH